jgi:protease I
VHVIVPRPLHILQSTGSGAQFPSQAEIKVLNPSGEEARSSSDRFVDQVHAGDYDAVYLPGNRTRFSESVEPPSVAFLRDSARTGRPIFAIGNSSLVLLQAGLLDDRQATGDEITRSLLAASSATAIDAPLVSDGAVHTSRDAFDMPELMESLLANLLARPQPVR